MSDASQLGKEQLLAVTAAHSADSGLDDSAALLRERFLAFGRAVEHSAEGVDEAGLIESLQAEFLQQELGPRVPRHHSWPLLLAGALAASVLVAAVGITLVQIATNGLPSDQVVVVPPSDDQQSAEPVIARNHASAAPEPRLSAGVSSAGVSSWDDPLDVEIQAAQSRLAGLRGQGLVDGTLTSLSNELDSISYDLEGGSL
jgi:hypothetical protein